MTTPTFTSVPSPAPQTTDPADFDGRADAVVGYLSTMVSELTTGVNWIAARVTDMIAYVAAALASQNAAAASATAAAASANAALWNALTNYAIGARAISAVNFQAYTAKTGGVHATDPSADATNWVAVNSLGINGTVKTANYTAVAGDQYMHDTSGGSFTVNGPAAPSVGDAPMLFHDYAGTFGLNNVIFDPGAFKYRGAVQTCTLDINNFSGLLAYTGPTWGYDWL